MLLEEGGTEAVLASPTKRVASGYDAVEANSDLPGVVGIEGHGHLDTGISHVTRLQEIKRTSRIDHNVRRRTREYLPAGPRTRPTRLCLAPSGRIVHKRRQRNPTARDSSRVPRQAHKGEISST
jgi:hypothetical protein